MVTKIYDMRGNFKEIENSKLLTKFYTNEGEMNLLNPLYNSEGKFIPFEFAKEHKNFLNVLMVGVTIGGLYVLNHNIAIASMLSSQTVTCLASPETTGVATTSISGIWDRLRPLISELISGADVLGVLAVIYCGILYLMGQSSKGKKVFKTSIGGYLMIRLSPLIIDIVRVFTNATI